jgi:LMBR1 domain-containing protein 1
MEFFFILISAIILFATYFPFSKADIPIKDIDCTLGASGVELGVMDTGYSTGCGYQNGAVTTNVAFAIYLVNLIAFVGFWIFILFLGVGISAIPIDLINDFRKRPRKIDPAEFRRRRTVLLTHVQRLREEGKHLESMKESLDKRTGWNGWKGRRGFNRQLTKFETQCLIAEKEFVMLEKVSDIKKTEPILYYLKLIAGIVLAIMSFMWILHIFLWVLVIANGRPVHPFFNNMLDGLREGKVEFLSTSVF